MGYSNKSIILHYLSYGFVLSLLGSAIGLVIGPLTIPYLFYPTMSSTYSLPSWGPSWDISFFFVAGLMVVFIEKLADGEINLEDLGNIDEIIEMCASFDHFEPTIDFAHVHARGRGILNEKEDYNCIFSKLEDNLDIDRLHCHFTTIEYMGNKL